MLMHEAHHRGALADGGSAALDRAGADVAGGVDAGDGGFEQALGAGLGAGEDEALLVAGDAVAEPVGAGGGAEEEEEERVGEAGTVGEGDGFELAVAAVQLGDFAAVADVDAVALQLLDQVVGHRLGEVGTAVQEGDEGAAAGQPDRRLTGWVAAADDADALAAADLRLRRPGGVEDAEALVALEVGDREFAVFGPGGEDDSAGRNLVPLLEPDQVMPVAGLQRLRPIGRGGASAELARLGDGAARQLAAGDPRREAEVVLDPPRGPRLAAEHGALDHQRLEPLRGAVDRGAEAGRPA